MGFWDFLSSAKTAANLADTVPKVVDSTIKGLDALVFTTEEKSKFIMDLLKQLHDQFMPRAISRRIIAILMLACFDLAFRQSKKTWSRPNQL